MTFNPIDQLYYDHPAVRIAGLMAFAILREPDYWLRIDEASSIHRIPHKRFDTLRNAMSALEQEHRAGFAYRGQHARYRTRYQGNIRNLQELIAQKAGAKADQISIVFDSVAPSAFRQVLRHYPQAVDWTGFSYPSRLNQLAGVLRNIFASDSESHRSLVSNFLRELLADPQLLWGEAVRKVLNANIQWVEHETSSHPYATKSFLELVSLGQHYEYGSTMIDVTSSISVAAWFASHYWDGRVAAGPESSDCVIYRFDVQELSRILQKEINSQCRVASLLMAYGLFGFVSLDASGDRYGRRPLVQHGGSLFGCENSITWLLLSVYEAVQVYVFPRDGIDGSETGLRKEDLCPSNDPALAVFRREDGAASSDPLSQEEFEVFLVEEGFDGEERGVLHRARATGAL